MKILHVVGSLSDGGAALGAKVLHEQLLKLGVNSKILYLKDTNASFSRGSINSGNFFENISAFFWQRVESKFLSLIFTKKTPAIFTTGLFSWSFKKYVNYYNIDIVNLHWPGYGCFSFSLFSKIKVVFTMRDMWLATAGCHYPMNCTNYMNTCSNCPALSTNNSNLINFFTKTLFMRKKRLIDRAKNFEIVSISKFVTSFQNSPILASKKIHLIENFVDLDHVKDATPILKWAKSEVLKKPRLLIPKKTKEPWKGYDDLELRLSELTEIYEVCQFGRGDAKPSIKDYGFINSRQELYGLFKSISVFICPTKYESFGKVIIESGAAGTPVIIQKSAKIGIDKTLPFIFEADFSSMSDLVLNIKHATLAKFKNERAGNPWFDLCKKRYSPSTQAKKYLSLYRSLIK